MTKIRDDYVQKSPLLHHAYFIKFFLFRTYRTHKSTSIIYL